MGSETVDYSLVLVDLEGKRVAIDGAIAAVRQLISVGADQTQGGGAAPTVLVEKKDQPAEVKFDSFFGMSTPDAVRKYLGMMKRPQLASDISKALLEGGLPTTSNNIGKVVGPTLSRMKTAGDLIPIKGKWALAEWYPAGARDRLEALEKGKKKRGRPKKSAKKKTAPESSGHTATRKSAESWKPTPEQIAQIMTLHGAGKKPGEIAKETGVAAMVVGRIVKKANKPAA